MRTPGLRCVASRPQAASGQRRLSGIRPAIRSNRLLAFVTTQWQFNWGSGNLDSNRNSRLSPSPHQSASAVPTTTFCSRLLAPSTGWVFRSNAANTNEVLWKTYRRMIAHRFRGETLPALICLNGATDSGCKDQPQNGPPKLLQTLAVA